jgi:uncharacterized protein (TIGR02145 family)
MKKLISIAIALSVAVSLHCQTSGSFTDARNGRVYKTIQMNGKTWMAENLEATTFRNGDTIPLVTSNTAWNEAGENGKPACCYYKNKEKNGPKLGLIYNWYAINDSRGIAPEGWRMPSSVDMANLLIFLGDDSGLKLKSKKGWFDGGSGNDEFGFNGIPSGARMHTGEFDILDGSVNYWLEDEKDHIFGYTMLLFYNQNKMTRNSPNKWTGCSIRCIKD